MSNRPPNPFEPVPEDIPEDWRQDPDDDECHSDSEYCCGEIENGK